MNLDTVEMLSIDQRSIAKLLKLLKNGGDVKCRINKIMDNISWKLGREPNMISCEKVVRVDVIAESILNMDLINTPFAYYIVEVVDTSFSECVIAYNNVHNNVHNATHNAAHNATYIDTAFEPALETTSKSQFIGACICSEDDFTSIKINCYTFIDWLNGQDLFTNKFMKKITIVNALDTIVHIKVEV